MTNGSLKFIKYIFQVFVLSSLENGCGRSLPESNVLSFFSISPSSLLGTNLNSLDMKMLSQRCDSVLGRLSCMREISVRIYAATDLGRQIKKCQLQC